MSARKLDFYLNSSDALRKLALAARRLDDLQRILAENTPPELTNYCCVKHLQTGVLTLSAANAAIATQLRQISVRLLAGFRKQGEEVTSIRIEVQVGNAATATTHGPEKKHLSVETIENIQALADGLEASPLKDALTRLAARPHQKS
jgi:hypothetical protein